MAKGTLNKVILIGRLGTDPEVRYMPSGGAVANLRLATNEAYKDKAGQMQEQTEWHRVVLFGRAAEIAGEYLKKGRLVYIEGRIRTNKWQDQAGQDRYTTEIVASDMQLLGGGGREDGGMDDQNMPSFETSTSAPAARPAAAPKAAAPQQRPQAAPKMENFDQNFDDDIPF